MSMLSLTVYFVLILCVLGLDAKRNDGPGRLTCQCKAIPNTPGWPSEDAWAMLNTSTGGRLLQPSPPAAVCHSNEPSYNSSECSAVQSKWSLFPFHDNNPISVGSNEFTLDCCLPEASLPCSSKGYPVYVINATTAEHAKLGVDFARENNIRLVVKSSGHDYLGRSAAPYSLSIWTRYMGGTILHEDSFTPQGCQAAYNGSAVTAGGGSHIGELVNATALVNQTVISSGSATVSVGGYLTGGGHGLLSARYGLATDQVLEMEIVTPNGDIVTANACQNQDLFWAMRGGGGSTFGVLTSVTVKTYPSPSLVSLILVMGNTNYKNESIWETFAYLLRQYPRLGDLGMSGYSFFSPETPPAISGQNVTEAGYEGIFVLQDTQNPQDIMKLWNPILDYINATWPGWLAYSTVTPYPNFKAWYNVNQDSDNEAGVDILVGSHLLDEKALTADPTTSIPCWKQFSMNGGATAYLVAGKGVANARPAGGSNSVNPAWRRAYVHATNAVIWPPGNSTAKQQSIETLAYLDDGLQQLAPDMGAYINEANAYQPNWQQTFWGTNYPRLLEIKRDIDPNDVFWCHPCVGSERWHEVDGQLCRIEFTPRDMSWMYAD